MAAAKPRVKPRSPVPSRTAWCTTSRRLRGRRSLRAGSVPLKKSELVAVDLVRDIGAAGLQVGDRLPDEGVMLMQYGVSRDSLPGGSAHPRGPGLITIHRGPGGGPGGGHRPAYLARTATLYFHLSGATYDEMFETWFMIEPAVAEKGCRCPIGHEFVGRSSRSVRNFLPMSTRTCSSRCRPATCGAGEAQRQPGVGPAGAGDRPYGRRPHHAGPGSDPGASDDRT